MSLQLWPEQSVGDVWIAHLDWKRALLMALGIFEGLLTMQARAFFHNLVHISVKTEHIFMKILSQMYSWTLDKEVFGKFW